MESNPKIRESRIKSHESVRPDAQSTGEIFRHEAPIMFLASRKATVSPTMVMSVLICSRGEVDRARWSIDLRR
jgi:hypothetical protein